MTTAEEIKAVESEIEEAVQAGEKFSSLFYKSYDKTRHKIDKLYHDSAQLVWEGNGVKGKEQIAKFLQDLPGCYHTIDWMDSQPVRSQFTQGKQTIMVAVGGTVKYEDQHLRAFTQNFTVTSVDNTWKIISDVLRLRDP